MMKRLSLCLMAVLLLVLPPTAYAEEESVTNTKTVVTATLNEPQVLVEVSVPTSGDVQINPYGFPVKIGANIEDSQVVSAPAYIENLGQTPLRISVSVTGEIKSGSDMALQGDSTTLWPTTSKKAFLYFEILAVSDPDDVDWADEFDMDKHVVVRDQSTKIKKGIAILGTPEQKKNYGVFRLTGDCIENPKIPWTEEDGVDVEIVFTFTPMAVWTEIP